MASKSPPDFTSLHEWRIVLVGKTGSGKSSLGNTLLGEKWFHPDHTSRSGSATCESATKEVMNKQLTVVDTPGLFDTRKSEEEIKSEIISSIVECSPGVHAFLIVLKVEKFTTHEEEVVTRIFQYFSEEVLKYSVIVFTHGDQLPEGTIIQQFVDQNHKLKDLAIKCGGCCHVFDSRYWKNNNPEEEYRSNSYQLKELLNTVEKLVDRNNGDIYTNEMLQEVERLIQKYGELIRQTGSGLSDEEIRKRAKDQTIETLLKDLVGFGTGLLLAVLLGIVVVVGIGIVAKRAVAKRAVAKCVTAIAKGAVNVGVAGFTVAGGVAVARGVAGNSFRN